MLDDNQPAVVGTEPQPESQLGAGTDPAQAGAVAPVGEGGTEGVAAPQLSAEDVAELAELRKYRTEADAQLKKL